MSHEANDDACSSSDSSTTQTTSKEACSQHNPVSKSQVPQAVHKPLLVQQDVENLTEQTVAVASGWHESYGRWWQEEADTGIDSAVLFSARMIGDAQTPSKFTCMSWSDLACCSKWGRKRVTQHACKDQSLQLVSPVLTAPPILHQAVAGMLFGQITLSASNVEAVLVLANAIGLGNDLGLSTLEDGAVDALIQQPWLDNMVPISHLLAMPVLQQNTAKIDRLLHHPNRGACTELQVLELLEMAHMSENTIASILKMGIMQSSELDTLLIILVNTQHIPGMLLGKAVQQSRLPEGSRPCPSQLGSTRILHNIMMPDTGVKVDIEVLGTGLCLHLEHTPTKKDGTMQCGLYVMPSGSKPLARISSLFKVFALHTHAPYVKDCASIVGHNTHEKPTGHGFAGYMSELCKHYPAGYKGPFTLGVQWQPPTPDFAARI